MFFHHPIHIEEMNNTENTAEGVTIPARKLLNVVEAARYLGVSKAYIYKLMNRHLIPYYKPTGKCCYFSIAELDAFMTSNRVPADSELSTQAGTYCLRKGGML